MGIFFFFANSKNIIIIGVYIIIIMPNNLLQHLFHEEKFLYALNSNSGCSSATITGGNELSDAKDLKA